MSENRPQPGRAAIKLLSEEEKLIMKVEEDRQRIILVAILDIVRRQNDARALSEINGNTIEEPVQTDTYIAVGVYSGNGPHWPYSTAVRNEELITKDEVAAKMAEKFPKGCGSIPQDSRELPGTSHGSLVAYWCYAVPQNLTHMIDWDIPTV